MYLSGLQIHSFRNIQPTRLEFSPYRNYLFGDNAQGKTNLIEAIYLLCLAKSFRTNDDSALIPFQEKMCLIEGAFESIEKIHRHVGIMYDEANGKQIKVDGKKLHQYSKLVGLFPIIILSANDHEITAGPPAQRRRFFNILLSQSSSRYLDDLKHYEKILKQRNKVLAGLVTGDRNLQDQLEVWDVQLVAVGARIIAARAAIVADLNPFLNEYYARISSKKWSLRAEYRPNISSRAAGDIETSFAQQLKSTATRERIQRKTLVGPHRDDFVFYISDYELRRFGSRGEHKSALVSLKAAEAHVLQQRTDMPPILLLDDLFAELDRERSHNVLQLFNPDCQIFVTGTSLDWAGMKSTDGLNGEKSIFNVHSGTIDRAENGQKT